MTIGQVAPTTQLCSTQAIDVVQLPVTSGNTYAVPGAGRITSWSHNANLLAGTLTMKVFRKVADPATYMVVGHDGPRPLAAGTLNNFPASIPVKPGDVLGLNLASPAQTACVFPAPGDSSLFRVGNIADGGMEVFGNVNTNTRLNLSAVFVPSNTFSLGKPKLNKKKGTATLAVNVPNPGTLKASGKGVKAASAGAVISKQVSAAGKVKLVIRAKGKQAKTLKKKGTVKLKAKITYTPTGGEAATQTKKLKLKRKRKKR